MTGKEAVRYLMKKNGCRQNEMLDALKENIGVTITQGSLSDRLGTTKATSLNTANLNQMLHAMGYQLVVMPEFMKTPDVGFTIDDGLPMKDESK